MGGGSTQVSFQVDHSEVIAEADTFEFSTCSGKTYRLYAHSYLGFGMDYAQDKLRELWSTSNDPCYPVGYARPGHILINGSGSSQDCEKHVHDNMFITQDGAPGRYSSEVKLRGSFAATENFFYVRQDPLLELPTGVDVMREQAKDVCGQALAPTTAEREAMIAGVADARSPNKCFGLSYQAALLQALHATAPEGVHVEVMGRVGGASIDWALGAALVYQVSRIGTSNGPLDLPVMRWTESVLLVVLTAMTLMLLCRQSRKGSSWGLLFNRISHLRRS